MQAKVMDGLVACLKGTTLPQENHVDDGLSLQFSRGPGSKKAGRVTKQ
jgi:hypothetical protein